MTKKVFAIILLFSMIFAMFSMSTFRLETAKAATAVSGVLSSDTTWTKAESPYNFTGSVGVAAGAKLTIEAGVVIYHNGYHLQVNGTLVARGSPTEQIVWNRGESPEGSITITFNPSSTDWNETSQTGSIFEYNLFNRTTLQTNDCSPKISRNTFDDRFNGYYGTIDLWGSSIVSENYFSCRYLVLSGSNYLFSKNLVVNIDGLIHFQNYGSVLNNTFRTCTSIICYGNVLFLGNDVSGSTYIGGAIQFDPYGSPRILNNTIRNNFLGIYASNV
jgi:hypothetical protein